MSIIYCECVFVALGISVQQTSTILYCHPWPARFYNIFSTLPQEDTILEKTVTEYKICVLIFSANQRTGQVTLINFNFVFPCIIV